MNTVSLLVTFVMLGCLFITFQHTRGYRVSRRVAYHRRLAIAKLITMFCDMNTCA